MAYQWYLNGASLVPNATNSVYVLNNANPNVNNGQTYTCVLSNSAGAVTSAPAVLTVIADVTPPTVLRVAVPEHHQCPAHLFRTDRTRQRHQSSPITFSPTAWPRSRPISDRTTPRSH